MIRREKNTGHLYSIFVSFYSFSSCSSFFPFPLFFVNGRYFCEFDVLGGGGAGRLCDARDVITYFTTINRRARRKTESRREKTSLYFVRNNFWRQLLRSQRRASYPGVSAYPNINGLGIVLFTTPVSHNSRRGEIWMHLEDGCAIDRRTNPRRTVRTGSFLSNENCNKNPCFFSFTCLFLLDIHESN